MQTPITRTLVRVPTTREPWSRLGVPQKYKPPSIKGTWCWKHTRCITRRQRHSTTRLPAGESTRSWNSSRWTSRLGSDTGGYDEIRERLFRKRGRYTRFFGHPQEPRVEGFGQTLPKFILGNTKQIESINESEVEKFFQLLFNPLKDVQMFHIVADGIIQLEWRYKNEFQPVYLATFTTCWARLRLDTTF